MCCTEYVGYMQVIRDGVMGRAAWSLYIQVLPLVKDA